MSHFRKVLNQYFEAWNLGLRNKNGTEIRMFMSEKFIGYWAHSNLDCPEEYRYDYDIDEVLMQYNTAEKSFNPLSFTERNNGDEMVVMGREINIIDGEPYPAQCMFIWRKEEGQWKLVREYIELER
ncbi:MULTISPECIES: nuclear transport factor 2 family protein [Bacillus]|uniref:nuclear transport factor 2 family protein n=1 Tax=Bacillus TaxID=1386 RepID=UPI0002D54128|nr:MULTISPECIES: nuclear transport factor 2 family protein [Bacillus]